MISPCHTPIQCTMELSYSTIIRTVIRTDTAEVVQVQQLRKLPQKVHLNKSLWDSSVRKIFLLIGAVCKSYHRAHWRPITNHEVKRSITSSRFGWNFNHLLYYFGVKNETLTVTFECKWTLLSYQNSLFTYTWGRAEENKKIWDHLLKLQTSGSAQILLLSCVVAK